MALFSKPKAVLWPKDKTTDLYLDKSENNIFSVDLNLWQTCTPLELQSLDLLLAQNGVESCGILVPDDVVYTKSFIYDSEITSIDKAEVIGLAESFINFKINPECLDYKLIPSSGKTIIQAHIFDRTKINTLETNLKSIHLKSFAFESVSGSIAKVISQNFNGEYFLIYPLSQTEYTLMLSKHDSVYLTSNLKGSPLEIQKIVNYSKLYFTAPTTKLYIPSDLTLDINATSALDKIPFNQGQIALDHKKPANLPLPVLGLMISNQPQTAIINSVDTNSPQPHMENKKNILPFIAVFVITAAIASIIIWFVLNKNNSATPETPVVTNPTPTAEIVTPTETPMPTLANISKKLKLQVLNSTDINGQAALLKEKLTKLGFTSVAVGNSKDKLTANEIKVKAAGVDAGAYFQSQLAGYFDAAPTTDLPITSTYDVVFYIGTDLSKGTMPETTSTETATPSAKVTAKPTAKTTGSVTPSVKPTATPTL